MIWQEIASNLSNYEEFSVTVRSIRDKFTNIMKKYKSKTRKEIAGTGLGAL